MVVEVDWEQRIRCQAPGCGKPVYKRIHVVREDGHIVVVGSHCWLRNYANKPGTSTSPQYGSSQGRILTAEERERLLANTAAFVAQIEHEALAAAAAADAERAEAERRHEEQKLQRQPLDLDDKPYVPDDDRHTYKRADPRTALEKYREQEAQRVAQQLATTVPAFRGFPERWIARAMLRAKAALVANGLKLDEPGSRQQIEAGALKLLERHYRA